MAALWAWLTLAGPIWGVVGRVALARRYRTHGRDPRLAGPAGALVGLSVGVVGLVPLWWRMPRLRRWWAVVAPAVLLALGAIAAFRVAAPDNSCVRSPAYVTGQVVDGLLIGAVIATAAIGLTLIFSVLGVVSFAHGQLVMGGGVTAYLLLANLGQVNPLLVIPLVGVIGFGLGAMIDRGLLTPLHRSTVDRPDEYAILVTFGFGIFLQYMLLGVLGPTSGVRTTRYTDVELPGLPLGAGSVTVGPLKLDTNLIVAGVVGVVLCALLVVFLRYTWLGRSLRAVSENPQAASVAGINAGRSFTLAFGLGAMLAAMAGATLVPVLNFPVPEIAAQMATRSYVVVVLGGLGSVPGAFGGGLFIGVTEALGAGCYPDPSKGAVYQSAFGLVIFALVLLARPQGFFGEGRTMTARLRTGQALLGLVLIVLAAGPQLFFTTGYALDIARLALYLAVLAASWSFLSGVAGQFSFAHVAIAGLGGYAGAIWSARLADAGWIAGWGPSIVVGTAFGTVVGALLGLLLRRLAGAYLALFTIAFAEVARLVVVAETDLTGGRLSLAVRPGLPGAEVEHYYVMLGLLVVTLALVYGVVRSRVGLNLRAMREDSTAASAMGINVGAHKLFALALAAALAALAGSVYFHTTDRMAPENLDLILMSQVIAYAVIGGLESPLAASLAAIVASLVLENLRQVRLNADEILVLAAVVAAVPVAIAVTLVWRAVRRHRWRPLLRAGVTAVPWAAPGFAAFAWWLHAPPGAFGGATVTSGWLTLIASGVLVVVAGSVVGRRFPAAQRAFTAVLVAIAAVLLAGRLYIFLGIDTELGVWRLAVFGGLLALTLRFAPNGLFTPILDYFAGRDRLRALAVRHRDTTETAVAPDASASEEVRS